MRKIEKNKIILADLALLIVAAVWGGGFVAVKDALDSTSPYFIMTMRFAIATLLMGLFFWKKIKKIDKSSFKAGSLIGIILFFAFAFQTIGLQYTTASKQSFVTAVYVVMVPFLYWIVTKKRPKAYNFLAAFLCLGGIWFLTLTGQSAIGGSLINKGDSLTLICALLFAAHIVAVGHFSQKHDPIILTVIQLGVSGVLSFICMIVLDQTPTQLGSETMIPILYLAILSTFLAFLIQNVAQKYTYSTHAALIMCLEALFGAIFAVMILNEALTMKMVIGCVLIFVSIFISELGTKMFTLNKNKKTANTIDR